MRSGAWRAYREPVWADGSGAHPAACRRDVARRGTQRSVLDDPAHLFVQGDIGDTELVERLFDEHQPSAVVNFAAESHVDRSIDGPRAFVDTNVVGTFQLLQAARQ